MTLKIQETPQAPSYSAANIEVPANIATPQATLANVKDQQSQLNAVNSLTGGGRKKRVTKNNKKTREYQHRSFIRTYKGRRYQEQKGGTAERIAIPQVGSTCSSGPQCAGAQNASLTALHNQAQSNSINDAYVTKSGGGSRKQRAYAHFHKTHHGRHGHHGHHGHRGHRSRRHHNNGSLFSVISHKIKKVLSL
ncbi:hypothetical protein EBV26_10685 [bacterium]|nr:hypothetical protein [bacterium]